MSRRTYDSCRLRQSLADGRVTKNDRVVLFNCATGLKYRLPPVTRALDRSAPIDYASLQSKFEKFLRRGVMNIWSKKFLNKEFARRIVISDLVIVFSC